MSKQDQDIISTAIETDISAEELSQSPAAEKRALFHTGKLKSLFQKVPFLRKRKRKPLSKKKIILLCCAVVLLAAAIFLLIRLFSDEELPAVTDTLSYGSLSKSISGTGTTTAADSVSYSLPSMDAEVVGWYVAAGDMVEEGDLLFEQDDTDVDELIQEYEDEIMDNEVEIQELQEKLADAQESLANLTVSAPFAGRVSNIVVEVDDSVSAGRTLATITDDSTMKITQYFSYIYQDLVYVGMPATLSVPDQMLNLSGSVTAVSYVDYVSSEGVRCFGVTVKVDNPGTLTEGMLGECWLTADDGTEIYASSENDLLEYANEKTLTCKTGGTISAVYVDEYQSVSRGATLFRIDSSSYESQINSYEKQIENYQKKNESLQESIEDAEESREDYKRYSEITGKVVSAEYETMRGGMVIGNVSIYNLDTMTISVNFDEMDVDQLSVGQSVTVYRSTSTGTEMYDAEITYISLEASNSNGVATFEGEITIYSDGALSAGVNVSYYVNTGDTAEGLMAPVSAIRSYDDGYYLILKADRRPDNAIDVDVEYPDGYYAVPVEIGSSNSDYVYIVSGANEGDEVFLRYQQSAPGNGDTTSSSGGDAAGVNSDGMPDFSGGGMPSGGMPDFSGGGMPSGGSMPAGGGMSGFGG